MALLRGRAAATVAVLLATVTAAASPPSRAQLIDQLAEASLEASRRAQRGRPSAADAAKLLEAWRRVADAAATDAAIRARHPYAASVKAILQAADCSDDAVAELAALPAADWVASSFHAGCYEMLARRLLQNAPAGPPAPMPRPSASTAPPVMTSPEPIAAVLARLRARGVTRRELMHAPAMPPAATSALQAAVRLYAGAIAERHAWLASNSTCTGRGRSAPATAPAPADGDPAAQACCPLDSSAHGGCWRRYPQLLWAKPPTLLYRGLGTALQWLGRHDDARTVHAAAASGNGRSGGYGVGWVHQDARPIVPLPLRVPPQAFYDLEREEGGQQAHAVEQASDAELHVASRRSPRCFDALLVSFQAALPAITAEFVAAYNNATLPGAVAVAADASQEQDRSAAPFVPETAGLHSGQSWSVLPLAIDGQLQPSGCALAPATCQLLKATPLAAWVRSGQAKFSVMRPGTYVRPHAGPSNARLRMHCTLQTLRAGPDAALFRVGNQYRHWREGGCWIFDESFEHEVWTAPDATAALQRSRGRARTVDDVRAVLLVDIVNPLLASSDDLLALAIRCESPGDADACQRFAREIADSSCLP